MPSKVLTSQELESALDYAIWGEGPCPGCRVAFRRKRRADTSRVLVRTLHGWKRMEELMAMENCYDLNVR